jgi:hypothetical protein
MNDSATATCNETSWEISIPMLNNRVIVGALVKVFGIASAMLGGLLAFLFALEGEWHLIPKVLLFAALVGGGLILLGLFCMGVIFRNRMRFRYTVSSTGILFETIDKTAKTTNRLAIILGLLLRRPQAVGAGLIATSQEVQELKWRGSFCAVYRPGARLVILRNRWRQLMIVYCTAENYAQVADSIRASIEQHGTADRLPKRSPLPRALGYTGGIIVACVPLFALHDAFGVSLLLPILVLCFALAMLWMIALFGYVVLGTLAVIIGSVLLSAFEVRKSYFHPGETYAHWSVFSGDDWALLVVAGVAMALLAWLSVRFLRGRTRTVLDSDMSDMGA